MSRANRASVAGVCYHVINHGNGRQQVFHKDGDYEAFLKAMAHACVEIPMPVLGYCLMPNHFHLGRFKSFPIVQDEHLLTVLRYAERNAVRAGLARRAEQWLWSSARFAKDDANRPSFLATGPVKRPRNWLEWVNAALTAGELEAVRRSVERGSPYGSAGWMSATAARLGLESTLRPRGRPCAPEKGATDTK